MKQPKPQLTLHDCVEPGKLVNAALRGLMFLALFIFTMQSFATMPCNHAGPSAPDSKTDMAGCHDSADKLESWAEQHPDPASEEAECCDNVCPMNACNFGGIAVNAFFVPFYSMNAEKLLSPAIEHPSAPTHFIFRPPIFA